MFKKLKSQYKYHIKFDKYSVKMTAFSFTK